MQVLSSLQCVDWCKFQHLIIEYQTMGLVVFALLCIVAFLFLKKDIYLYAAILMITLFLLSNVIYIQGVSRPVLNETSDPIPYPYWGTQWNGTHYRSDIQWNDGCNLSKGLNTGLT